MRILKWNVRGLSAPDKRFLVRHHLEKNLSEIALLQETKINQVNVDNFLKICWKWVGAF